MVLTASALEESRIDGKLRNSEEIEEVLRRFINLFTVYGTVIIGKNQSEEYRY